MSSARRLGARAEKAQVQFLRAKDAGRRVRKIFADKLFGRMTDALATAGDEGRGKPR